MKKIIDGKTYNTETAECICCYCVGDGGYRDLYGYEQTLYRTKNGTFFLFSSGGPGTNFADNPEWKILEPEEARDFVQENGSADEYINAFGEPEEA